MKHLKLGFIGNFKPYFSTENDRKWTLQMMGHNVVTFQEDETVAEDLIDWMPKLDGLFYSHTHDPKFVIKGLRGVFADYKRFGVPTMSIHLDKWVGLERVKDVGKEATWFTEYLFMADGSLEAARLYNSLSLKWFYLPAGVIARDCYLTPPDPIRFPHEIVFIGSRGYHKEYPFRAELVDWLANKYGDRFGHYGNDGLGVVRGHDLNVLCSTAKLVVGDSCFGGQEGYVSDRYYEIRGRGGLLIHPLVKGFDKYGVTFYNNGDLKSLEKSIDYVIKTPSMANRLRLEGFHHVQKHETYTQRMERVLKLIYG